MRIGVSPKARMRFDVRSPTARARRKAAPLWQPSGICHAAVFFYG